MAKKSKFKPPRIFDKPLTFAIRSAMSLPLIAGVDASVRAAGAAGRAFATSFMNRRRIGRAHAHLAEAFPELDKDARHELAIKSYEHLFKLGTELCFAPRLLTEDGWARHVLLGDSGAECDIGLAMRLVQDRAFLHIDVVARVVGAGQLYIIADLAFEGDIADQPTVGFRVKPGHVACVGIAVRVAVRHIKDQREIVAAGKGGLSVTSSDLRKNSLRWW